MKTTRFLILIIFLVCQLNSSFSQGTKWTEFKKNLDKFFASELLNDISNYEPLIDNYMVYSWDVGDYSGDGYSDLAVSVRKPTTRGRNMIVLLFADVDGYLSKVGEFEKSYIDLPLEVGVAIRNNAVFITEKVRQFEWNINGYSLIDNEMALVESFTTKTKQGITEELSQGYFGRKSAIRYLKSADNTLLFEYLYGSMAVPSNTVNFPEDGSQNYIDNVDYISEGAYWWENWDDLSYSLFFNIHDENLNIKIEVKDDNVIMGSSKEKIQIRLASGKPDRNAIKTSNGYSIKTSDFQKYEFTICPFGEGYLNSATGSENSDNYQYHPSIATLSDRGYSVYVTISLNKIGSNSDLLNDGGEIFYNIEISDIDDRDNPTRVTTLETDNFKNDDVIYWNSLTLNKKEINNEKSLLILNEYGF